MTERWAIFISGNGTTAQAALDCLAQARIQLVMSSKAEAFGLVRARRSGVATFVLDKKIDWQKVEEKLKEFKINCVFLLGFMKIIPAEFCLRWQGKIWNVHPSLLPMFKGRHAIEESYQANAMMGVSIHEVTPGMDEGPLTLQQQVLQNPKSLSIEEAKMWMTYSEQNLIRRQILQIQRRSNERVKQI